MQPQSGGVVVFYYADWISQYPEFAVTVSPSQAQGFFDRITIGGQIDNTPTSVIQDLDERTMLIYMGVSHLAELSGALNASRRELVGRVTSATQGSVSVQSDFKNKGGENASWWNQTSYGAQYYAATLKYRTATYFPPVRRLGRMFPGRLGSDVTWGE